MSKELQNHLYLCWARGTCYATATKNLNHSVSEQDYEKYMRDLDQKHAA